jgi:membrane protein
MNALPAPFRKITRWFTEDLWNLRARNLPFPRRVLVKYLKIILLSGHAFRGGTDSSRAAALTLYTLLSIVPVMALLFGIAKGFGLDARLEAWLLQQFSEQQEVFSRAVDFARRTLNTAEGGLVAGAGVAFLLYTVLKVVGNIEDAFNHIWSIAKPRPLSRRFTDYFSLILVGPFLILGASSLTVFFRTMVSRAAEAAPLTFLLSPAVRIGLYTVPFFILWLLFSFMYSFIPNTKVRIPSALFGGAFTALLYLVVQSLYIDLQVGVSRNNAIYGSFAALPLFIVWLNISWHVVLLGCELTQQHQNFESNEREEHMPDLSFRAVKRLSLAVADYVGGRFLRGDPAPTSERIGSDLAIPALILGNLLTRMVKARLLVEVATGEPDEAAYQPARDPRSITPAALVEALEGLGEDLAEASARGEADPYAKVLADFDRCIHEHPANRSLGVDGPAAKVGAHGDSGPNGPAVGKT